MGGDLGESVYFAVKSFWLLPRHPAVGRAGVGRVILRRSIRRKCSALEDRYGSHIGGTSDFMDG
jgi:hypothetical protein